MIAKLYSIHGFIWRKYNQPFPKYVIYFIYDWFTHLLPAVPNFVSLRDGIDLNDMHQILYFQNNMYTSLRGESTNTYIV